MEVEDENSPADSDNIYEKLINIIFNFLEYYEKRSWDEKESVVEAAFKTAHLCESIFEELAQGDCLLHIDTCLSHNLSSRFPDSKSKKYDVYFLRRSCDALLEKFLRSEKKLSNETVRLAVLSYMSLCSKERCSSFLDELAVESVMFKSVCEIKDMVNGSAQADIENVSNDILHQQLSQLANQNQIDLFKKSVKESIIRGTVYNYLHYCFESMAPTTAEVDIRNHFIQKLLEILQENTALRSKFWKENSQSDLNLFPRIACSYPDFLSAMLDIIKEVGEAMAMSFDDTFQLKWTSTEASLTYNQLIALIKCLIDGKGVAGDKMRDFLLNIASSDEDDTNIWSQMVYVLNLRG